MKSKSVYSAALEGKTWSRILTVWVCFAAFPGEGQADPIVTSTINSNTDRPNIVFILTDDHRWDSYGAAGRERVRTPNLDQVAEQGTRFANAFVTLAICSPSRAACLTGRYGSVNGVTSVGKSPLNPGERTFAEALSEAGYATGVTGKWHLKTTPQECGFEFAATCWSNGTWYDREFTIDGKPKIMPGFVDDVAANESIRFIEQATESKKPFVLWFCTQVPHMDHRLTWPAKQRYLDHYSTREMPLAETWNDDLAGKPPYLAQSRSRIQAVKYGYDDPQRIREHTRDYRASVEQMDVAVGRVLSEIQRRGLTKNTWIILMGDNGWFLGEHGFTSKVLAYEESMRVPMAVSGPGAKQGVAGNLVLNIDLTATIYDLAGLPIPSSLHGRSLLPILTDKTPSDWRKSFLYEAPTPQLGSRPLWAIRDARWKYVETQLDNNQTFTELYDLTSDTIESKNLANDPAHQTTVQRLATTLDAKRKELAAPREPSAAEPNKKSLDIPSVPPKAPRTDLLISGVFPHLTTYGIYSQNGAHYKAGHNECGIGAIVPWAGKLWMVNYAPHMPRGSEHKLYSINSDLSEQLTIHSESVGGTPAGRMIHQESNQLLIGHHLIDSSGKIRTISPADMPIRVTAIARHLSDPKNKVYYIDMEGSIWEANVHTLTVKRLFKKPVPGWHGKGGYTSQGRLVISNNGELHVGDYSDVLVGGKAVSPEERGVLAEFDGENWSIVERRQYTEVTGPKGVVGGSDGDDPIWSMGWDRRSVRLKVLDQGEWHTYLLPKAAYCNDASHGWYTEWPRIREITNGRWMMDMHGMFFDFPKTFSSKNSAGIRPIGSHLRYVPDFCAWKDSLVLATDETSIQGNPLAGQPQSNLWFGSYEDLKQWGPASAFGGPWIEDDVTASVPSDPFLVSGFDRRALHLAAGRIRPKTDLIRRTSDQLPISDLPQRLAKLPRVTVPRGDWKKPANGFQFRLTQPATVYLAVDGRGLPALPPKWKATELSLTWGKNVTDRIFACNFPASEVAIPANSVEHSKGAFGTPHLAFVKFLGDEHGTVAPIGNASVELPPALDEPVGKDKSITLFTIQLDRNGNGDWVDFGSVAVPDGEAVSRILPSDMDAVWLRLLTNRDCLATAVLHQTTSRFIDGSTSENTRLFSGLADIGEDAIHGLLYPAKRNRDLRVIAGDGRPFEFTKADFAFKPGKTDAKLNMLLAVEPEFTVDAASVVLKHKGTRLRLPKGNAAYDKPFASGWPRASREVESERHLANIHGTFYEVPLVTNGAPPAWNLLRPVSSHSKQITDFCSWNGLLVLAGVRVDAPNDGHVFRDDRKNAGLWFGGIDDLWKLGKPIGRGGPWLHMNVQSGVPSDPYLMKGYDRKTVTLSNQGKQPITITLQADIDGTGLWVDYKSFKLRANKSVDHEFPVGYSACWIRAVSDQDTSASVQFEYR